MATQIAPRVYELLGVLFTYPDDGYMTAAEECVELLRGATTATEPLSSFLDRLRPLGTNALQELFTVTFDLNPVCALEVGWHLYGEAYERGAFMVHMRQLLRDHGIAETAGLPDHLAHLLAVLPRLAGEEAGVLVAMAVRPSVEKMRAALLERQSPFAQLTTAVLSLLDDQA